MGFTIHNYSKNIRQTTHDTKSGVIISATNTKIAQKFTANSDKPINSVTLRQAPGGSLVGNVYIYTDDSGPDSAITGLSKTGVVLDSGYVPNEGDSSSAETTIFFPNPEEVKSGGDLNDGVDYWVVFERTAGRGKLEGKVGSGDNKVEYYDGTWNSDSLDNLYHKIGVALDYNEGTIHRRMETKPSELKVLVDPVFDSNTKVVQIGDFLTVCYTKDGITDYLFKCRVENTNNKDDALEVTAYSMMKVFNDKVVKEIYTGSNAIDDIIADVLSNKFSEYAFNLISVDELDSTLIEEYPLGSTAKTFFDHMLSLTLSHTLVEIYDNEDDEIDIKYEEIGTENSNEDIVLRSNIDGKITSRKRAVDRIINKITYLPPPVKKEWTENRGSGSFQGSLEHISDPNSEITLIDSQDNEWKYLDAKDFDEQSDGTKKIFMIFPNRVQLQFDDPPANSYDITYFYLETVSIDVKNTESIDKYGTRERVIEDEIITQNSILKAKINSRLNQWASPLKKVEFSGFYNPLIVPNADVSITGAKSQSEWNATYTLRETIININTLETTYVLGDIYESFSDYIDRLKKLQQGIIEIYTEDSQLSPSFSDNIPIQPTITWKMNVYWEKTPSVWEEVYSEKG